MKNLNGAKYCFLIDIAEELFGSQQDLFVLVSARLLNAFVPGAANGNDISSVAAREFSGNYSNIPINYLTIN